MNYRGDLKDINGNTFYPYAFPRFKGERNKYYYIGKQKHYVDGGSSIAGQLVLFISNMYEYSNCVAGFANISNDGTVITSTIVPWTSTMYKKIFYVYTDGKYDYVYIYAPNYNDNWSIEVLVKYNFDLQWKSYSEAEFNNLISDKTLVAQST